MDDLFDELLEYDFAMGADMVKCPHCGTDVQCSLSVDNEVDCPECGEKLKKIGGRSYFSAVAEIKTELSLV